MFLADRIATWRRALEDNKRHRHPGLAMMTPEDVHCNRIDEVQRRRPETIERAYMSHPERCVNGPPKPLILPKCV